MSITNVFLIELSGVPYKNNGPVSSQEIQLDELLTHEIQLQEANNVFELLKQPDCVKVLIKI